MTREEMKKSLSEKEKRTLILIEKADSESRSISNGYRIGEGFLTDLIKTK